ncbi:MAG: NEW3 domain-containing protein [Bacteroidales bacterium]|nr:NEW3 domain-containing protein [Bacteroidales bacterium]
MSIRTKSLRLFTSLLLGIFCLSSHAYPVTDSVTLYTPYTKISVPPGQSIDYAIDVINNGREIKTVDISLAGMPKGWNYTLKAGGWTIGQISILPGERKSFSLNVGVPYKVNKGSYRFKVLAGGSYSLPLVVSISEQGTFKTEFSTEQPNREGQANSSFTFNAVLKNQTADKQLYTLTANASRGWNVAFKSNYQQVTSVNIEANSTQSIEIDIKPPENIEAGRYKIPIVASTNTSSSSIELEVVITGSYKMELTSPTGLLSTNITAGKYKRVELIVNNTGSSELADIKFDFSAPSKWDVTFDPKKVDKLQAGKSAKVFATIKADKKAIPGDYVTNLEAKTPETSSRASFRISVETAMLWGWIGVLIIIAALGSVYYLFRKYGRR